MSTSFSLHGDEVARGAVTEGARSGEQGEQGKTNNNI